MKELISRDGRIQNAATRAIRWGAIAAAIGAICGAVFGTTFAGLLALILRQPGLLVPIIAHCTLCGAVAAVIVALVAVACGADKTTLPAKP